MELQHSYDKDSSHAIKYVGLNAKGTYVVSPNLDIAGKFNFRYQFNGESEFKDLELTGGAFVQHLFLNETDVYSDKFIAYMKNTDGYKSLNTLRDKYKDDEQAKDEFKKKLMNMKNINKD